MLAQAANITGTHLETPKKRMERNRKPDQVVRCSQVSMASDHTSSSFPCNFGAVHGARTSPRIFEAGVKDRITMSLRFGNNEMK